MAHSDANNHNYNQYLYLTRTLTGKEAKMRMTETSSQVLFY